MVKKEDGFVRLLKWAGDVLRSRGRVSLTSTLCTIPGAHQHNDTMSCSTVYFRFVSYGPSVILSYWKEITLNTVT